MRTGGEGIEIIPNMIKASIKRSYENRKACRDRGHSSTKILVLRIFGVGKKK